MVAERMKRISERLLLFLVLLALSAVPALAQDSAYRLQVDDVIRISVYNEQQASIEVPVGRDGNVSAPYVGTVKAEGKTTAELESELKQLYIQKLKIRDPIVSVSIVRFRTMRATAIGFFLRPGTYEFRPGDTLMNLIGQAGGPQFDRADVKRATLKRAGTNEQIPIDLEAMLQRGDTSQNYTLQDGDEFIVPENRKIRIQVLGSVQRPGVFQWFEGMRMQDAIALTSGDIRGVTKFSGVRVFREIKGQKGQFMEIKVDWVRFINKHDYAQNIELEGGDLVWVPATKTPSISEISSILNAAFFADRVLFSEGIFGLRPLSFIGR